jgi:hypothetical protein
MSKFTVKAEFDTFAEADSFRQLVSDLVDNVSISVSRVRVATPVEKTRAGSFVMSILSTEKYTHWTYVGKQLEAHGYQRTTAAPLLSVLAREGHLERKRGYYRRISDG